MADGANVRQAGDRIEQLLAEVRSMVEPAGLGARRRDWCARSSSSTAPGSRSIVERRCDAPGADASTRARPAARRPARSPACCCCTVCIPDDLATRVQQALERVRPYLGSHGGDVEVRRHRRATRASCGCAWRAAATAARRRSITVKLAVESAIREAAPEVISSRCRRARPTRQSQRGKRRARNGNGAERRLGDAGRSTAVSHAARLAAAQVHGEHASSLCRVGRPALRLSQQLSVVRLGDGTAGGSTATTSPARRCGQRYDVRLAGRAHRHPRPASRSAAAARGWRPREGRGAGANDSAPRRSPGTATAQPLGALQRFHGAPGRASAPGEMCEMCAADIGDEHSHVVNLENRNLLCTCRRLLSALHRRRRRAAASIAPCPSAISTIRNFELSDAQWDELQIPVRIAFFFFNSALGRVVAFYPSPAGATESLLPLDAWQELVAANPLLDAAGARRRGAAGLRPARRAASSATWCRSTPATSSPAS